MVSNTDKPKYISSSFTLTRGWKISLETAKRNYILFQLQTWWAGYSCNQTVITQFRTLCFWFLHNFINSNTYRETQEKTQNPLITTVMNTCKTQTEPTDAGWTCISLLKHWCWSYLARRLWCVHHTAGFRPCVYDHTERSPWGYNTVCPYRVVQIQR